MSWLVYLLYFIILVSSLIVGYLLAWLCKDEIIERKWFYILLGVVVLVFIVSLIFYRDLVWLLTLVYFIVVILISIWKSFDKKFVKN